MVFEESKQLFDCNKQNRLLARYLTKSIFTLFCLIACVYEIIAIITLYLKYPSTMIIQRRPMSKLFMPGITICNNNRLKRSSLTQFEPTFEREWSDIVGRVGSDKQKPSELQKLTANVLRNMIENMTVSEFMAFGHSVKDFLDINYTRCATDQYNPDTPCKDVMNVITTATDSGNCFTLFHKSKSLLRELAIAPGISHNPIKFGDKEAINLEISEDAFHPNELIRLKVNFQSEEYTTLNEPISGRIIIHDDIEVPIIREKNFFIEPGKYYLFYLNKEMTFLLPKPYATDCVDYPNVLSDVYNPYLHNPLSNSDCFIGCMARKTITKCNCWPPELPFIKGVPENSSENLVKWCDWNQTLVDYSQELAHINETTFDYCFAEHENTCTRKCRQSCRVKSYGFIKEVREWPSKERIEFSGDRDNLFAMRNCCAIISIRYWSSLLTVRQHSPKLNEVEIVSYIGGLLSMWIGFSFLGFYYMIENVAKHVIVYIGKNKAKKWSKKSILKCNNKSNGVSRISLIEAYKFETRLFNQRSHQKPLQ